MSDFSQDPIVNVIHNGIKKPIRLLLDNECYPATIILVYAGMDTMAFLSMPANQTDVKREDFVRWTERYIHFPCQDRLSGLDLYGARCSVLHTHGIDSALSRGNKCRLIGYADHMVPEVRYNPGVSKDLVMVSIRGSADAFCAGVDRFLIDLFADKAKAQVAERRFQRMHHTLTPSPLSQKLDSRAGEIRGGGSGRCLFDRCDPR
jgi:hypothetical protein